MKRKEPDIRLTLPAIKARINRKLIIDGQMLKRSRGKQKQALGEFYVMDVRTNDLVRKDVDLEKFAREIAALKPFEGVEPLA